MSNKKKKTVKPDINKEKREIKFPVNKNKLFYFFLTISFLFPFIIYLLTLAPTVTLEDSGELITAAYFLGIPHEPGYPLFVLFGKLFSFLPFGTIAFRVNMMSAFFSAFASMLVFQSIILILEDTFLHSDFWNKITEKQQQYLKYSVAFSGSLFFSFAYKTWEQSIIAEVYGINNFFIALFIFLFLYWRRQIEISKKHKYFFFLCLITGMAVTTHTTATMLIPILGGYILIQEKKILLNIKFVGKSILFFLTGLLPWLFLPIASANNPPVDWGNPETLTNLLRVITRHQYQTQNETINVSGSETFGFFFKELLPSQWYAVFLVLIPVGLFILFKKNRSFFYFTLFFLFMSIPVLSYLTRDFLTNDENKALVSVFYIPAYMIISILMAVGTFFLISIIKPSKSMVVSSCICVIAFPVTSIKRNYNDLDMHKYYFAEEYVSNIFKTLPQKSIYFVNWDPFGFPLIYYQFVEKKRKDIFVVDELLLKRSWYIKWLRDYFPEIMKKSEKEADEFLVAVAPFEAGIDYNGVLIQQKYIALINSLIDNNLKTGNSVYFAYNPVKEILRSYHLEPQFSAYKYTNSMSLDSTITDNISLQVFTDTTIAKDRMAVYMREYYGDLYGIRASFLEQAGNTVLALQNYNKALLLFAPKTKKWNYTVSRINFLKKSKT